MGSAILYENEKEEKLHLNAIRSIARETGFPEADVGLAYGRALEKLKEHAKIKDFLPVLVKKEVKDMLLKSAESGREGVSK
jgi:hypothetical protein